MTSLREVSGGRPIDRIALAAAFVDRLQSRIGSLRGGRFDAAGWADRQLTTGRFVRIDGPDGTAWTGPAIGVDQATGALVVDDAESPGGARQVLVGEVGHVRLATAAASGV